jgi:catechol 2,3-dioxygenase-like lactoylglutathione lyase family enzyme
MAISEQAATGQREEFVVGGVRLPRPFRIRRLGHFGINVLDPEVSRDFYCKKLGFRISDPLDFAGRVPEEQAKSLGTSVGYFARHGTDHHSFVFFPRRYYEAMIGVKGHNENTLNQITWQVGSLREVSDGHDWFKRQGKPIRRAGRDLPGSNWHFYPPDPAGHTNELYYGIEQVGWDGLSKPQSMYKVKYMQPPALPHKSEYSEVQGAVADGIDVRTGWRAEESEENYDVGGVLLARPFKVTRIGPVRLFVKDMDSVLSFYRDDLGLTVTEEINYKGHRAVFLRANTEHHSIALYPIALRAELGVNPGTTLFSFGMQVADYSQLCTSIAYLREQGVTIKYLPPELFPGIDYSAFAIDPDGHAIQLYYYMEQVGWDGRPRPASARPKIDNANWPASVAAASDTYQGEVYLGPLG